MSQKPEKILVVDDHIDSLELLSSALQFQGYEVEKSDRGEAAIAIANSTSPNLVILDICMPDPDGLEVCRQLKKNPQTKDIPIIFISALEKVESKTEAFNSGGSDYITKPFEIEEVIARVKNQLKNQRLQTQLKEKNKYLENKVINCQIAESKLIKIAERLNKLATIDSLTQIANRHYFDEFFTREWLRSQREQIPLSLVLCDIDYFKLYNDYFGHQAGDNCLRQVARTINDAVKRPADLAARYGGEEFAIILPNTPGNNALHLAEEIRLQVKQLCLQHPRTLVDSNYVSLSLGVSCVIPNLEYFQSELIATADRGLYLAKQQGRDRSIFQPLEKAI